MNIFFLSFVPERAARAHCDRHVVKMILESTQLLWTAQHILRGATMDLTDVPTTKSGERGYRPTHRNHPCAIWTRRSLGNYLWLCALATELVREYHYRYPTAGPHACESHIAWLTANPPPFTETERTLPAMAMPAKYKTIMGPVFAYRAYYNGQKRERGLLTYTRRDPPVWARVENPNNSTVPK
jgi:hypothetical protein